MCESCKPGRYNCCVVQGRNTLNVCNPGAIAKARHKTKLGKKILPDNISMLYGNPFGYTRRLIVEAILNVITQRNDQQANSRDKYVREQINTSLTSHAF